MKDLSSQFLEAVNGTLFALYLWLTIIVGHYLVERMREISWRQWFSHESIAAAKAMLTIFVGGAMIRGPVWWVRHWYDNSGDTPAPTLQLISASITAGMIVTIIGGMCLTRVLLPDRYGVWPWLAIGAGSAAFGFGIAYV